MCYIFIKHFFLDTPNEHCRFPEKAYSGSCLASKTKCEIHSCVAWMEGELKSEMFLFQKTSACVWVHRGAPALKFLMEGDTDF